LLGAGSAAAREHDPADGEGESDNHPNRGEVDETQHDASEQRRSEGGARSPRHNKPFAALDRIPEFLDSNLELLDLLWEALVRVEH
jgi:hypothetical protein